MISPIYAFGSIVPVNKLSALDNELYKKFSETRILFWGLG